MNTKHEGLVLLQKSNTPGRVLVTAIALIMTISAFFAGLTDTAYAAAIEQKNKQACDDCKAVVAGTPPDGYTPIAGTALGGGKHAVYSGGNSYSKANKVEIDTDTTDFANPLPYGDVYVDANKLKWDNPKDFIIDIQDDRFQWVYVSDTPLIDAEGNESTNDPMGVEGAGPLVYTGDSQFRGICYVGPLKSYLEDIKSATKDDGYTNVIEPKEGKEYLYQITYKNAVTLPDGTKGNLVLTMKKVQIETSVTVDKEHPYTPAGADYSYTDAFIKIQGANQLSNDTGLNITDANGKDINQKETQIMTLDEAKAIRAQINKKHTNLIPASWESAKTIRNATGNILDLDIEVTDLKGDSVNGTISYAAHDMDFESAQNIWGRPVDSKFAEAMTIVSGSQSYALVPNYNHLDATTRDAGWLPVGPGEDPLERALSIEKDPDVNNNADGVRFASPFLLNYRDANGTFDDVIFSSTAVTTFQGDGAAANKNELVNKNGGNTITDLSKRQLFAKLKAKGHTVSKWQDVTPEMAWQTLGNYSWKTYRNDDDTSFDSGFAVLLDSKESKLVINEKEAEQVKIIFDKFIHTDMGADSIAKYLNTHGYEKGKKRDSDLNYFTRPIIVKILDNPVYIGKITYGKRKTEKVKGTRNQYKKVDTDDYMMVDGLHDAIIDMETWEQARYKRKITGVKWNKTHSLEHEHLLTGIIKCPVCGGNLTGTVRRRKNKDSYKDDFYYRCLHRRKIDEEHAGFPAEPDAADFCHEMLRNAVFHCLINIPPEPDDIRVGFSPHVNEQLELIF